MLPVLTKTLGASGYGLWSQMLATIGLFTTLVLMGSPESMTRLFPSKDIEEIREDFYSLFILISLIAIGLALSIFLFPNILADALFNGESLIVRLLSIILLIESLDYFLLMVFRAFKTMKKYALFLTGIVYFEIGLAIILVLVGYGIKGAIMGIFIIRLLSFPILFFYVTKLIPLKKPNFVRVKDYLRFGIPTIPKNLSGWIIETSDRFVIGFFLGITFVGYYAPGYALGKMFPTLLVATLGFTLTPTLSKYYENKEMFMLKNVMTLSLKYFLIISIPYCVGSILLGERILLLFSTKDIAQNGYIIIWLSAIAGIFQGIYVVIVQIIYMKKNTKLISAIWLIGSGVNIVGNLILVPRIGIIGAGVTTLVSYLIVMLLTIYFSGKHIQIPFNIRCLGSVFLSAGLMSIVIILTNIYIWSNLMFLIILGLFIYFLLLFLSGGIGKNDMDFLKKFIFKRS
jgi:O-antigen/teichoic acid export membrane protein